MEQPHQLKDQRKHPRRPFVVPIEYITEEGTGRDLCRNISSGGLFFETGEFKKQFYNGQEILLNIPSRDREKLLKIVGKIVRVEVNGVGVKFKSKVT